MEYFTPRPIAKYIAVGSDGEVLFEAPAPPSFITSAFFNCYSPMQSPLFTSREYKTHGNSVRMKNWGKNKI